VEVNGILHENISTFYSSEHQAQMVRRVKAYLNNMRVITDEDKLHSLSLECEPSGSAPNSVPVRKRHPSPTLSTTSSTSSASEGKKGIAGTKFGEFHS
jgi:Rap guanine nucleotide exchange factor 2